MGRIGAVMLWAVLTVTACKHEPRAAATGSAAATNRAQRRPPRAKRRPRAMSRRERGSARCRRLDLRKLDRVIACYYATDATVPQRYRLLSTTSRTQQTSAQLADAISRSRCGKVTRAAVIGRDGSFARVSLDRRCTVRPGSRGAAGTCTRVLSATWVRQHTGWARVSLPRDEHAVRQAWRDGDYRRALRAAKAWLARDPNAVLAMSYAIHALERLRRGRRERDLLTRRALAVNPRGSLPLQVAISSTSDLRAAEALLDRLDKHDCARPSAVFNLAQRFKRPAARIAFIDRQRQRGDIDGAALILLADALRRAHRLPQLRAQLDAASLRAMRDYLRRANASDAAYFGAAVGEALLAVKRVDEARAIASAVLARAPSEKRLQRLLRRLPRASAHRR